MSFNNENELIDELKKEILSLKNENFELMNKQAEVDKAKELYLGILEDFPALIWRANTEKLCNYFNTTWLDFTGRTMEQEYGYGWACKPPKKLYHLKRNNSDKINQEISCERVSLHTE